MKWIQSGDNTIWKALQRLQTRKGREAGGCYLAEGLHLLREAQDNGAEIRQIVLRASLADGRTGDPALSEQWEELERQGIPVIALADALFDKLADTEAPQGVIGVVTKNEWTEAFLSKKGTGTPASNVLVLDRIQDPGNLGTLLRTADAAGYGGVMVIKGTVDLYSPKVVRAAAGSLFRLPVCFMDTPEEALKCLRRYGKRILVTDPHGGEEYFRVEMSEEIALVIGNEARGASQTFLNEADLRVLIPMEGTIESLNAAVAGAILMYESVRQCKQK